MNESYPRLVADIGGTNARFAMVESATSEPSQILTLPGSDYADIEAATRDYLQRQALTMPEVACIGIANPVNGNQIQMTNHHWGFSCDALRQSLGLRRLLVINDFTALAMSLQSLKADELRQVGGGKARAEAPIALIGAGTGLGVASVIPIAEHPLPLPGEGGHVTLAATNPREAAIIAQVQQRYEHVSAERLLSGPGLVELHDAIRQLEGADTDLINGAEISRRAQSGECPYALEALQTFCALLGTVAGNLALTLGAAGGLYIGGGIVPQLGEFFINSQFRERFTAKGRFHDYLTSIPSYVIHAQYPALVGASKALDSPHPIGYDSH